MQDFFALVGIVTIVFLGFLGVLWMLGFVEMGYEKIDEEEDEDEN